MDSNKLQYFKQKLLEEKLETLHTLDVEKQNGAHELFQDYYNELSVYDNHPADMGSELYEMEMRLNLEDKERKHLIDIENALKKIEDGTYGFCEACGKPIELDRLEIVPQSELCIKCNNKNIPLDEKMKTRPIEEDALSTPYSRTFKDESDYTGFDGEDSWQAVARYNKTNIKNMSLDWYDNNMYDEKISGKVEDVDDISDDYYERQIIDKERE
ncbi:MAG: hypothetical protein PWQ37_1044 [Candidatus Petromonas sp.]|nr:hypothetical protein [Candidatus Petromonas sp.]